MNDKRFGQISLILALSAIVIISFSTYKVNPVLFDLSPQSQHILQNYQNYQQTGQTSIPYNPSPIDLGQQASTNQYAYKVQQNYQQFLATHSNSFGNIPVSWVVIGVVFVIVIAVIIVSKRE